MQFEYFTDHFRMVAEIRRRIVKQGKRNVISRHFHARSDKETIATWRLDLNRILHIFNVRSGVVMLQLLIVNSQTELVINIHVTVSDIHHGVANTNTIVSAVRHDVSDAHAIVSNVQSDVTNTHAVVSDVHRGVINTHAIVSELHRSVANTHAIVSDIHHTMMENQGGANWSVSVAYICCITEPELTIFRLKLGRRSQPPMAYLGNLHHRHRGLALGATS